METATHTEQSTESQAATSAEPSQVRAKLVVDEIRLHRWSGAKTLVFTAVYGTNGENAAFTKATPNGRLEMMLAPDGAAQDFFKLGDTFYVDFTRAPN